MPRPLVLLAAIVASLSFVVGCGSHRSTCSAPVKTVGGDPPAVQPEIAPASSAAK